jgi:hypothetical protein
LEAFQKENPSHPSFDGLYGKVEKRKHQDGLICKKMIFLFLSDEINMGMHEIISEIIWAFNANLK